MGYLGPSQDDQVLRALELEEHGLPSGQEFTLKQIGDDGAIEDVTYQFVGARECEEHGIPIHGQQIMSSHSSLKPLPAAKVQSQPPVDDVLYSAFGGESKITADQ